MYQILGTFYTANHVDRSRYLRKNLIDDKEIVGDLFGYYANYCYLCVAIKTIQTSYTTVAHGRQFLTAVSISSNTE